MFYRNQFSSVTQSCPTLCDPSNCSRPGLPVHHQLPEFTQTHVHQVSDAINYLILCRPLLLLPSIFPASGSFLMSCLRIRWPKNWSFSFSVSPSNEYSGLVSFGMDWLDLLVVQGTLKSLLQQHSSKASILRCSAFFIVHLSHPYMTTGKTIALTIWTFISKVTSLPFNMLSRFGIALLSVVLPYLSGSILKPDLCSLANLAVVWPRRDHIDFAFFLSLHFCFFALYCFLHLSSSTWIQLFSC